MNRRTIATTTGMLVLLGIAGGLSACSGSSPSTKGTASATQQTAGNGSPAQGASLAATYTNGNGMTDGITVVGVGKATGTPDTLSINFAVEDRGASAVQALQLASQQASSLIALFKGKGIADKDMQTTQVNVWPQYDDKGLRIVGYIANESVSVKSHDVKNAGQLIDAAAGAVGDAIRLNGMYFSIEDTTALYANARLEAVKRARSQAEQLASAAGVTLGKARIITEYGDTGGSTNYADQATKTAAGGVAAPSTPIVPGSQELALTVTMVFNIQ
jgi:uncharacterized protein YggE